MSIHALSQREAADLVGVTSRAVRDWEQSGEEVPRNEDGSYDGPAFVQWYMARGTLDANRERARKDKEMADKLALENAVRRGELVEVKEVSGVWSGIMSAVKARIVQIPDALGQFCDARYAPTIVAESRRRLYEALAELAGGDARFAGAAADGDGESVVGPGEKALKRGQRRAGAVAN